MISRVSVRACLGGVLCALAFGAITLPASAIASNGHGGAKAHRAKTKPKKKKSSKGQTVKVKCASVSVTCKGQPGATGPQGPAGPSGAAGLNGANVVLRARGAGVVTAIEEGPCPLGELICGENVPLTPNTWTEGASEDDQMIGSATISFPSEAACGKENSKKELESGDSALVVEVDGVIEGLDEIDGSKAASTKTIPISFDLGPLVIEEGVPGVGPGFFIGTGTSQPHILTAQVEDDCVNTHTTVSNVAIDVLANS